MLNKGLNIRNIRARYSEILMIQLDREKDFICLLILNIVKGCRHSNKLIMYITTLLFQIVKEFKHT
jgi:hypothetical protein